MQRLSVFRQKGVSFFNFAPNSYNASKICIPKINSATLALVLLSLISITLMATILITGGTGFIGTRLGRFLKTRGYTVTLLSRSGQHSNEFPAYFWDIRKQIIDPTAILTADHIIHLAGENIGAKRWTEERKKGIISSRILPTRLLFDALSKTNHKPKSIITASAIGYYGAVTSDHIFTENDPAANGFLGNTCRQWEREADKFTELNIRTVKLRMGMVLDKTSGTLTRLQHLANLNMNAPLGKGSQYMPWIHIEDLCYMYLKAVEDETMAGVYNAVAPEYVTNTLFMKTLAKTMHKPFWPLHVPSPLVRLALGEMAEMVLEGSRVSAEKIMASGFDFRYPTLQKALPDLISNNR